MGRAGGRQSERGRSKGSRGQGGGEGSGVWTLLSALELISAHAPPPSLLCILYTCCNRCVLHRLPEDADLVILDFGINDFQKGDTLIHPERQAFERILRRALSLPK